MTKRLTQQDYWNWRAPVWDHGPPLVPDEQELAFMRNHLLPGGNTLILGATPQLCSLALEISSTVTAVDFAEKVIKALRLEGVEYTCEEWGKFFEESNQQFSTILTDGGLLSLEFPGTWEQIARHIKTHLVPGGIFAARVYLSTGEPPKNSYKNPNLERFVSSMGKVDDNWMVHPQHGDYKNFDMYYTFPPEREVLKKFNQFTLKDKLVPDYEEGARFVSYAWQNS